MKKALQFLLLFIARLYHIDSYAQIQKIEHKDRIGDSIEIIDIMPPQERIPLEPNFKGAWMLGGHIQTNGFGIRSEEHTSELQSRGHLVCRLLLEKKKHEELEKRRE